MKKASKKELEEHNIKYKAFLQKNILRSILDEELKYETSFLLYKLILRAEVTVKGICNDNFKLKDYYASHRFIYNKSNRYKIYA